MKKEKWLLLAVAVLITSTASAQLRFGVKGGVNIATVKFNKEVIGADNVTGFHIGPTLELGGGAGFGLDAAVLYSQKGFEASHKDFNNQSTASCYTPIPHKDFKNSYVEVPINLKYKIGMIPIVKPYVAVGPYFNFRVSGDKVWKYPNTITGQIKSKGFDTGLNLGIGAEVLNMVQVGLTYSWGFADNYVLENFEIGESSGKNRMWSISAAVFF